MDFADRRIEMLDLFVAPGLAKRQFAEELNAFLLLHMFKILNFAQVIISCNQ